MANEKEQLPVWLSAGIEPPETLKQNGWQAGVKPPAQYMDWFFNRTYMVLKQLQEDGGTTVEDTLTSDSTANALSAKQGKVLNGKYTELSYLFNNWHNTDYVPTKAALTSHLEHDASLTQKGHVQLSSATNSTDETKAATPKAVKLAYDRAEQAFQSASDGKMAIANAITGKGGTATSSDTFAELASAIGGISTGKKWASGTTLVNGSSSATVTLDFTPNYTILIFNGYYGAAERGVTGGYAANANGGTENLRMVLNAEKSFRILSGKSLSATVEWYAFE